MIVTGLYLTGFSQDVYEREWRIWNWFEAVADNTHEEPH